jgi:hypothetical protein
MSSIFAKQVNLTAVSFWHLLVICRNETSLFIHFTLQAGLSQSNLRIP